MSDQFDKNLGKKISIIRRKTVKLSQAQIAELLELEVRSYRNYESGKTSVSTERLLQLAKIFKNEPKEILEFTEDRIVLQTTFHNQKGNGINVQSTLSAGEKDIYERWIAEKNESIRERDEKILQKDEKINDLLQETRQQGDLILFLKEQLKKNGVKV
jgi:transcriptional regulator with XRE-family HTH domain